MDLMDHSEENFAYHVERCFHQIRDLTSRSDVGLAFKYRSVGTTLCALKHVRLMTRLQSKAETLPSQLCVSAHALSVLVPPICLRGSILPDDST